MTMSKIGQTLKSSDFKTLKTNIVSLKRVFTWSDRLVGIYVNDKYYDRNVLSKKQLEYFEFIGDFEEGHYTKPISL